MKQTVVYISSCAVHVDGTLDAFMLQELPWMRNHFDRVLICAGKGIAEIVEDKPSKLSIIKPVHARLRAAFTVLHQKEFWLEIKHLRKDHKNTLFNQLKLYLFNMRGFEMYYWIRTILNNYEQTTVYSYWMSYDGFAAALCKQKDKRIRAIARGHAFDIDVKRNPMNPYLMKRFMINTLDGVYPISKSAEKQIEAYADVPEEKMMIVGVGSAGEIALEHFSAPRFQDGVFHLVSCAAMVEIKQIPLLIDTLANWKRSKLHWVHIGGGAEEENIRAYAKDTLASNPLITYELRGSLSPEEVRDVYQTQAFDAFINSSRNEGTPVAIMEAMHAGIPIVAPAVGGIPELVDEEFGCLYPQNGGVDVIMTALHSMFDKTAEEAEQMSNTAQKCWNERCRIERLLPQIFPEQSNKGEQEA